MISKRSGTKISRLENPHPFASVIVVLIKSNFIGIPQYSMNLFKFPKYIFKETDKINKDFFWKDNYNTSNYKHKLGVL